MHAFTAYGPSSRPGFEVSTGIVDQVLPDSLQGDPGCHEHGAACVNRVCIGALACFEVLALRFVPDRPSLSTVQLTSILKKILCRTVAFQVVDKIDHVIERRVPREIEVVEVQVPPARATSARYSASCSRVRPSHAELGFHVRIERGCNIRAVVAEDLHLLARAGAGMRDNGHSALALGPGRCPEVLLLPLGHADLLPATLTIPALTGMLEALVPRW